MPSSERHDKTPRAKGAHLPPDTKRHRSAMLAWRAREQAMAIEGPANVATEAA